MGANQAKAVIVRSFILVEYFFNRNKTCVSQICRKQVVQSAFLPVMDYGDDGYILLPPI